MSKDLQLLLKYEFNIKYFTRQFKILNSRTHVFIV